jgi:group II intron reverse transcriptase/maturase
MSVLSNDGIKTWLTKLDRIGELSASQRDIVFNNLGHIINYDLLKELYYSLDGNKAVGVDKVTKDQYGENLRERLTCLLESIRRGTYKPKPARITEIPKEDGSTRPLAISCFEDKLVQLAVSTILGKIYEPLFLDCSYGFRPGRGCHDAIKALNKATFKNWNGAVVEIDIKKYFNRIPHKEMMLFLNHKISDKRFLRLINVLVTMPIIEGKVVTSNTVGCPQGSIISPILANIYLHYVIDLWFRSISRSHIKGRAEMVRYADDMVFTFESMLEAKRFYKVLPKRLAKFGLEMHTGKSSIIPAGHVAATRAHKAKRRLPTFNFLGFTCYWGISRRRFWTLRFISRRDRFAAKLKGMKEFLRKHLTTSDTPAVIHSVIRVVRGWVNYHYISYNRRKVISFIESSRRLLLRWFNRRGGKKRMTWQKFAQILDILSFPRKEDFKTMSVL